MAVSMVVLAPAVFVWSTSLIDAVSIAVLRADLRAATADAERALAGGALDAEGLAEAHRVRVRVLDGARTVADADRDRRLTWHRPFTDPWFGPEGRPLPSVWDARLPPLGERAEMREAASRGEGRSCEVTARGDLLICAEARAVDTPDGPRLLHVQSSNARAARALYEDRFQMTQLTLSVLVFAVLLTVWLATRWVRPIESLRDQALARTTGGSTEPLRVERSDELGEVADAFNTLLASIAARNRANELFAADLAHELKNPIAAVRTAADALGSGRPVDPERAARLHRILDDSGRRMQAVIDRFLDLARAEAGLADAHRAPVDVAALLDALLVPLRADERFAAVEFAREGASAAVVPAAAERLETALRNLLVNAATFAAGRVPARVVASVAREQGGVVVAVSDTGPGIEAEDLPRVFDRYFSKRPGGTGLGLALTKAIVEAHGGSIAAESPPGAGATFVVRLPSGA